MDDFRIVDIATSFKIQLIVQKLATLYRKKKRKKAISWGHMYLNPLRFVRLNMLFLSSLLPLIDPLTTPQGILGPF